ncbi:trehalose-phosphatase [Tsukamurella sp. 8F]|uniref:trehalose-phosphatase n=1 Tax=unclassified Tsukamurella TaxID=2633480 RepID=UPI0023B95096|nr:MULTISPECIES: trehalose-phosphatase [unclassified Tsukamurella]MDF0528324.1 trehalose-phosphatase [Tsukamurella sp. 8J]MDF0586149.1 trehalose-phosphatase [Tsukamurella sp. 8F]
MTVVEGALRAFAELPTILVATDYDGVVAPIVTDPARAFPLPGTVETLRELAALPGVTVALISGRDRATLLSLSGAGDGIITVGSHGAEFDDGFAGETLTPNKRALLAAVIERLEAVAAEYAGAAVEIKPTSAALHVRNVATGAEAALDEARRGPAALAGVQATEGKAVLELAVVEASKGRALETLRAATGADGVLYLGDDVTDEKAFAVLAPPDVSVKVGPGDTVAKYRVPDPDSVLDALHELLRLRRSEG